VLRVSWLDGGFALPHGAVLHEAVMIQDHLTAQDKVLTELIGKVQAMPG
jgi:hypothetical protein